VAIPALGILSQQLLWEFKNFDLEADDPKELLTRRDDLFNVLEKLLQEDIASKPVQQKV